MEPRTSARPGSLRDRVRKLGYDPEHLTPAEQRELVTLDIAMARASSFRAGTSTPAPFDFDSEAHRPDVRAGNVGSRQGDTNDTAEPVVLIRAV